MIKDDWSESTVKWNNKPGYGYFPSTHGIQKNSTVYLDVTTEVQYMLNHSSEVSSRFNEGFILRCKDESGTDHWTIIYSKEWSSSDAPKLEIKYIPISK